MIESRRSSGADGVVPRWVGRLPGLATVAGLAGIGLLVERWVPLFGAAVVAVVAGVLVRSILGLSERLRPGVGFAAKQGLQIAIVLLGTGLGLQQVGGIGGSALAVLAVVALGGIAGIWGLGRLLRVSWEPRALLTVGTVVCGGTAIGVLAPTIRARSDDVAVAIGVVFGMNLLALLVFPPLGGAMGLDQAAFGVWAGAAINDTSSVVAAGYSVGEEAGDVATVVKLVRTTLILPLVIAFGLWAQQRAAEQAGLTAGQALRTLPAFLLWFVAAAGLQSVGVIDALGLGFLPEVGRTLMVMALAGVGLGADLGAVRRAGPRPLVVGAAGWLLIAVLALATMAATGWW
ncbi:YeiH family protein [Egibacter rhizosphaerae]|uniref:YeiH family protein n=1 Tax=Egibacter rhizosphaerae TaxID=1670831 RepID=UPI0013F145A4|nr:putative sulfate exporter family transporter [Egibacter rhizosphaerae]